MIIIIIIIKNECHSNIIVDRLQGCSHSKKLRESESPMSHLRITVRRHAYNPIQREIGAEIRELPENTGDLATLAKGPKLSTAKKLCSCCILQ